MRNEDVAETGTSAPRRYHVHVYTVIRTRVAVAATDHHTAMEAADRLLFDGGVPVALISTTCHVEKAEHADEVTGHLVDEVGKEEYGRTRSYGPDYLPETA